MCGLCCVCVIVEFKIQYVLYTDFPLAPKLHNGSSIYPYNTNETQTITYTHTNTAMRPYYSFVVRIEFQRKCVVLQESCTAGAFICI